MTTQEAAAPEIDLARFGRAVRALRREAGLTQEDLARRSGVTQTAIARIETGRSLEVRLSTAVRLAEALRRVTGFGLDAMTAPDDPARRTPRW